VNSKGISFPRSDLGEYENRLRRAMALDGLVPLQFEGGSLLPVVVVDDLTRSGMAPSRGRRFGVDLLTHGVGNVTAVVAQQDVTIELVTWSCAAAGTIELWMFPDISALGGGVATNTLFMDRFVSITDRPNILSVANIVDPGTGRRVGMTRGAVSAVEEFKTPFTLNAGTAFGIKAGATTGTGMAYGWVF